MRLCYSVYVFGIEYVSSFNILRFFCSVSYTFKTHIDFIFWNLVIDFFSRYFFSYRFSAHWQAQQNQTNNNNTHIERKRDWCRTTTTTSKEWTTKKKNTHTINKRTPSFEIESKSITREHALAFGVYIADSTHKFTARVFISTVYRFLLNLTSLSTESH